MGQLHNLSLHSPHARFSLYQQREVTHIQHSDLYYHPTCSALPNAGMLETSMDIGAGSSVVFSVNPPSPLESDLCPDEQESILKTWNAGDNSSPNAVPGLIPGGHGNETGIHAQLQSKLMDHGTRALIIMPSTSSEGSHSNAEVVRPSSSLRATSNPGRAEPSGKKATGGGVARRSVSRETHRKSELYKTELCVSVHSGVPCKYGDNCQFAHSTEELQYVTRHPRYKTQFCTSFQSQGYCKYNDRCTFIHHPEEARVPISSFTKKRSSGFSATPASTASSPTITRLVPKAPVTPATAISSGEAKPNERIRALSDPGHAPTNFPKLAHCARTSDLAATSIAPTGPFMFDTSLRGSLSLPTGGFGVLMTIEGQTEHFKATHTTLQASTVSQQQQMSISGYAIEPISTAAATLEYHRGTSGYAAAEDYETVSALSFFGHAPKYSQSETPLSLNTRAPNPMTTVATPAIWGNPLSQEPSNPWRTMSEMDSDEEWASKLAFYISTPQNDFEI